MTAVNKHFSEHDRIFYSDGYRLAQKAIQQGLSKQILFEAIESMYEAIDGLNDSITSLASHHNQPVACKNGCYWCCHQAVYANSYELHYLSEKIKQKCTPEKISMYLMAAETKYSATSVLSETELAHYKSSCPLLENDSCSMYEARPMACRIYLSTNLETCLEFFHHPENEQNYPALIDFPLRAGRMINEGFMAALKENGIQTAEFRLEEGLKITLKNVDKS